MGADPVHVGVGRVWGPELLVPWDDVKAFAPVLPVHVVQVLLFGPDLGSRQLAWTWGLRGLGGCSWHLGGSLGDLGRRSLLGGLGGNLLRQRLLHLLRIDLPGGDLAHHLVDEVRHASVVGVALKLAQAKLLGNPVHLPARQHVHLAQHSNRTVRLSESDDPLGGRRLGGCLPDNLGGNRCLRCRLGHPGGCFDQLLGSPRCDHVRCVWSITPEAPDGDGVQAAADGGFEYVPT